MTFGPNDLTKFFAIVIAADYDISTASQQIVTFTASGTDATVYVMPGTMTFNISEPATDQNAGVITTWGQGTCTKTGCAMAPSVSLAGTLWWALSARQQGGNDYADGQCPSIDTIKTN